MNKLLKAKIVEIYGNQFLFARAIAEHETVVSKIIRGKRILDPVERSRWAKALRIDDQEKYFAKGEGNNSPACRRDQNLKTGGAPRG